MDEQENGVEQAQNKAIDSYSSLVFSFIEGLVMPQKFIPSRWEQGKLIPGRFVGDDRHFVDYEPEKMARLATNGNGNMEMRDLTMYRNACERYARIHGGLDETRGRRYQNVVAALELLV